MFQIHATTICYKNKGILITGLPKSGKSILAFLFIKNKAILVSDDQTILEQKQDGIYAKSPASIQSFLEIRALGIIKLPFKNIQKIDIWIHLHSYKKPLLVLSQKFPFYAIYMKNDFLKKINFDTLFKDFNFNYAVKY